MEQEIFEMVMELQRFGMSWETIKERIIEQPDLEENVEVLKYLIKLSHKIWNGNSLLNTSLYTDVLDETVKKVKEEIDKLDNKEYITNKIKSYFEMQCHKYMADHNVLHSVYMGQILAYVSDNESLTELVDALCEVFKANSDIELNIVSLSVLYQQRQLFENELNKFKEVNTKSISINYILTSIIIELTRLISKMDKNISSIMEDIDSNNFYDLLYSIYVKENQNEKLQRYEFDKNIDSINLDFEFNEGGVKYIKDRDGNYIYMNKKMIDSINNYGLKSLM